jgi:hypothetical protein
MRKLVVVMLVVAAVLTITVVAQAQDSEKKLLKKLNVAYAAEDWSTVCSVTKEIGALNTKKAVRAIVSVALGIQRKDIYDAAKEALGEVTDEEAIAYMCEQARKNKKPGVRQLLVEVIGEKDGDTVYQTLLDCLKDRNDNVVRGAVLALKAKGDNKAVDNLIELLDRIEKAKGLLWVNVRKALHELTNGYDFTTAAKWREFWERRKEDIKANPGSPETAKPTAPGEVKTGLLEEEKKKAPKFFGQEVMSKKIMFVIDRSGSMQARDPAMKKSEGGGLTPVDPNYKPGPEDSWGGDTSLPQNRARIERVKNELSKCIAAMDPKTKFNVIYFSSSIAVWQKKLVYANSQNKKSAIKWISGLGPMGNTHTDDALKKAFENQEFDTLFFLSDGQPFKNRQLLPVEPILEWVRNANRQRKVKIFTFGFEGVKTKPGATNREEMLKLLQGLAKEHGGKFTNIYW